jgi:pimeloyl-ACP methyl ester carboxylesterase
MDRRGRGASGDSVDYSLLKEAEDVAAIVNSRPDPVFVLGHSYGAVSALEAAFLTRHIAKLMLYEPPLHDPAERGLAVADRIEAMINAGQLEMALITFQTEIGEQSPDEIEAMKARPSWPTLVSTIQRHPRQMRALAEYKFDASRMEAVTMPTMLLIGEDTGSPYIRRSIDGLHESLPNSVVVVLENQQHNAMDGAREALANAIVDFVTEGR